MKFLFLTLTILIVSCIKKPSQTILADSVSFIPEQTKNIEKNPDTITITAHDLSEDMSRLSTKNDEVFILIYNYSDTNKLAAPLVSSKLIFDMDNNIQSLSVPNNNKILFFIEEDSFRNMEQIEPVIRIYFKEIMKCKDYNQVKKYLGEDDLLGIKIIDDTTLNFTISGKSSLDKFNYSFVIK